jgi:adenylate cyclase
VDFESAGLLDGLEGDAREARLRLLEQLEDQGFGLEELTAAVNENRLALLPVERVLGGRYTVGEIAERTGLVPKLVVRFRRLQGLPEPGSEERVFSDEDLEGLQSTKLFLDAGFSEETVVQTTRVLGESMARLAATVTASFVDTFLEAGDSEEEVALRFAALAEELTPRLTPVLVATFKAHLRDAVSRGMLGRAELTAGQRQGEQEVAVCFADLVGFTRLGGQIEVEALGSVAGRLSELAAEVVVPPVRLVKTIGDAAMFVSPEPGPLVDVALSLVEAVEEAEMPALRAGIAIGPALQRAGDFYGHSVNVASRVTGIARPGSVLCTEAVHDAAPDSFGWSFAGRHRLKGVKEAIPLFRARRPAEAQTDGNDAATKPRAGRPRRRASR